eukprot:COSAG02_NODE_2235_length_9420_cov_27.032722_7_plen_79_part_00
MASGWAGRGVTKTCSVTTMKVHWRPSPWSAPYSRHQARATECKQSLQVLGTDLAIFELGVPTLVLGWAGLRGGIPPKV